ncbi:glycosyltransferase [Patescibacteria group bacterium]|nr:glycosyltransferase [Patescibacteria group bacterium]MBU1256366.1 glycosyltransferase [Patescibacteria group bacterium]MBU1457605.1 glycosyltransferase [Patescibacteria group bacterium]
MKPKLSVVICTKGRDETLKETLESLKKQSFKNWELVVVRETPLSKARDLGWRRSKGEIVAWIDDDVVLDKDWAKNLVKIFDENKDVGGVSGPTIVPADLLKNRMVFWWYGAKGWKKPLAWIWKQTMLNGKPFAVGRIWKIGWWSPGSNFKECLKLKGLQEVDYLEACNMSLRRSLVKKVGGFDLGYEGTSEWCEVDLAMRVARLGQNKVNDRSCKLVWSREVKLKHMVSRAGVYVDRRRLKERFKNYFRFYRRHIL